MSDTQNRPAAPRVVSNGIVRDQRTGQIAPGSRSLNPGGRPGRKQFRNYLKGLIGEHGERAYDGILAIAEGRETYETLAREPAPHEDAASVAMIPVVRKFPSIRERLDAWTILAEHLNGKPSVEVHTESTINVGLRDYRQLSDAQLEQFETLLRLADQNPATETVEGEIVAAQPQGATP